MAFTSQVSVLFVKSVATPDAGVGEVRTEFEQSIAHSGAGTGAGGPSTISPPPSANAMADIEATRRQVAKKRASFVIKLFFLFIGRSLSITHSAAVRCY